MRRGPRVSGLAWAGLLVVWTVAWSVTPGRIAEDTKNDLYVDPWHFLGRALHLWDPQVTWGGLQNQAFGYLFPMGPFFGLGSEFLPMWIVQRLWWTTLLTAGFVAMLALLRALDVKSSGVRVLVALAYVLAPRVVSTIGGLSSEAQPQLLAPAVLLPLVLVDRGRLGPRGGAALSGLAILCCGGVNATATAFAILPAALWLLTRPRWWRQPVTWVWGVAVAAATSWWVVPLVTMGRYSPPFLNWIENANAVSSQITLLDVLRGTTHWLGHLVTSGGVWWPAGHELVTSRTSIMLTTAVMAAGLAGLTLRPSPHRRFLFVMLLCGVVALSLPHEGPFDSPLVDQAQAALDGPLVALRNIHKADLLVRLALAIGLAQLLTRAMAWRPRRHWLRGAALTAATAIIIGAAAPAFSGAIATRGTFTEMASQWKDLGSWLETEGRGRALIVPAANFGEYTWGRTIDEPLRSLSTAPYAVRDAVPLTPAGTIRLLDEVERRLQTGRSLGGATQMLRSAGVRYLVVRNDLSAQEGGQPPVALARSSVRNTSDVTFTRGFGSTVVDSTGERVHPVEVYSLVGEVAPELALWDSADVVGASGAPEDLARLAGSGVGGRPVIFDGDRNDKVIAPTQEVVTDGFRARTRWFGAPRGQDLTNALDAAQAADAPDYLPWPEVDRRSVITTEGVRSVRATASIAQDFGFAGLQPAHRPFAALDGDERTAWAAQWSEDPELTIDLESAVDLGSITLQPLADRVRFGEGLGVATEILVTTDHGSTEVHLPGTGAVTTVTLPVGPTTSVRIAIHDTTGGPPSRVVTGLAEVGLPGITPREVVTTPVPVGAKADTAVLSAGLTGRDGCASLASEPVCFTGELVDPESTGQMVRDVRGLTSGTRIAHGTLAVNPLKPPSELMTVPGVRVTASSLRGYAPVGLPVGVIDSDPHTAWSPSSSDESPSITLDLDQPTTVTILRLDTRRDWALKESPAVIVGVDGTAVTRRLQPNGVVTIPPTTGRRITLTFIHVPGNGRPGLGALELENLVIAGRDFAPPGQELAGECGSGPTLTVDGRAVPTSARGPRSALFGLGEFSWQACGTFTLTDAETHRVVLDTWHDLAPRTAVIRPQTAPTAATPTAVPLVRDSPTALHAQIGSGTQRLLVMAENPNPGWEARVDGHVLTPQVVDGHRQGFVVPAGLSGALTIEFGPDGSYRWGLLFGALLAAMLVVAAVWPDRRRRTLSLAATPSLAGRPRIAALGVILGAGLLAGPVGLLVGLVAVAAARWLPRSEVTAPAAVFGFGLVAAAIQTWLAPGAVGTSAVEGTVRLLVLAAFALAAATAGQHASRKA
ncbi:hypothetical protein JNB_03700 [Janibacter sp. HTCC2649]|uniref:alpha-(1->3)-arabinofuranosyltransferase domain-containing protein n=1 Tax=Janibacter sp. HTCC2649 TaxID=313589 RepID=UPI000066EC52|nr:alpha-(1->3)-arabinofuranosyltransferase family protein [Janibacter sp. HTCC2649]EAP99242.1 hypothetical protein JNB_03700 [Janibacter sp. HTCC2649]